MDVWVGRALAGSRWLTVRNCFRSAGADVAIPGAMRSLLAMLVVTAMLFTLQGCVPLGGCGAYSGAKDKVYLRGTDQLILCENGGFTVTLASKTIEGYYTENPAGSAIAVVATEGDDQAHAFDLSDNADGTASIPELGTGAWQLETLDKTALDHADTLCQALETRTWWSAPR
jgi:hypothetical protein